MKTLHLLLRASSSCVAAAMLAQCAAPQTSGYTPSASSQSREFSPHAGYAQIYSFKGV
jgi:hypothetical protein